MNDQGRMIENDIEEKNVYNVFKRLERAHKTLGFALKLVRNDPVRAEMIKHTHPKFRELKSWHDVMFTFLNKADATTYSMNKDAFFADVEKQSDECFALAIEITSVLGQLDKKLIS